MKMFSKKTKGFATMEILIAFSVLILVLTAIVTITFGSQTTVTDSQTNHSALYKAQSILEASLASAVKNYDQVFNSTGTWQPIAGGLEYATSAVISNETQCSKQISANVDWTAEYGRPLKTTLSSTLINVPLMLALSGDCNSTPPGYDDWKNPDETNINVSEMQGQGTALDIKNKIVFSVTKSSGNNKDDFFIIDATNMSNPISKSSLDLNDSDEGLEDIDVAGDYAFIANDKNATSGQLIVVDITDLYSPTTTAIKSLPGVSGECEYSCPGGRSIYYYDNQIYFGTHRTGGHEFHIFNVSTPSDPKHIGSMELDHNINDIVVREQTVDGVSRTYAYLATSGDTSEVIILNVTNPDSILDPAGTAETGSIINLGDSGANDLDATKLYIVGNRAYVGRERAVGSDNDFYILDISNPAAPTVISSWKLDLNSNGNQIVKVSGVAVSGDLVFLGTRDPNDPFQVWNISTPAVPVRWEVCEINFSTFVEDLEMQDNLIYMSMGDKEHNPMIVEPTGGACSLP